MPRATVPNVVVVRSILIVLNTGKCCQGSYWYKSCKRCNGINFHVFFSEKLNNRYVRANQFRIRAAYCQPIPCQAGLLTNQVRPREKILSTNFPRPTVNQVRASTVPSTNFASRQPTINQFRIRAAYYQLHVSRASEPTNYMSDENHSIRYIYFKSRHLEVHGHLGIFLRNRVLI